MYKRQRVTHGERVVDARSGLTKLDLLRYYDSVAERMLPHLRGRAVALLRAPAGVGGETFFQKHLQAATMPGVRVLDASLWPGHEALLDELGLHAWLKTSGGKGLHVVVPLAARWDFDTVKGFSQAVVQHLAQTVPQRFVAKSGPANRVCLLYTSPSPRD